MLKEGTYRGNVVGWGLAVSSRGTDYFNLEVRLTHQEGPLEGGKKTWLELPDPVRRNVPMYLSEGSIGMTLAGLRSLGYTHQDLDRLDPAHEEAFDFGGMLVTVTVRHEEWNGRTNEKVQLQRSVRTVSLAETQQATKDRFLKASAGVVLKRMEKEKEKEKETEEAPPERGRGRGNRGNRGGER